MIKHIDSYIQNELKQASGKMRTLLDVLKSLQILSFDRGNRNFDMIIKEKVESLAGEISEYYRTIQSFISGKTTSIYVFSDILAFFNEHYLTNNKLAEYLAGLKQEIDRQLQHITRDDGAASGNFRIRRDNIFLSDFKKDLIKWEYTLTSAALPYLNEFLIDVNEILLFYRLNSVIKHLITGNDIFIQDSADYPEFKKSISRFLEYHIMLTKIPFSEAAIEEFINQTLQRMGFRMLIMKSKNMSRETYAELIKEIIKEGDFNEFAKRFARASYKAIEAIKLFEQQK
ncbi:MAG TPA: hypothetical protein PKX40_20440 [Spirochaetota bacterium]|nr:hypothetical protein [Spirochaetota bacterium]